MELPEHQAYLNEEIINELRVTQESIMERLNSTGNKAVDKRKSQIIAQLMMNFQCYQSLWNKEKNIEMNQVVTDVMKQAIKRVQGPITISSTTQTHQYYELMKSELKKIRSTLKNEEINIEVPFLCWFSMATIVQEIFPDEDITGLILKDQIRLNLIDLIKQGKLTKRYHDILKNLHTSARNIILPEGVRIIGTLLEGSILEFPEHMAWFRLTAFYDKALQTPGMFKKAQTMLVGDPNKVVVSEFAFTGIEPKDFNEDLSKSAIRIIGKFLDNPVEYIRRSKVVLHVLPETYASVIELNE